MSQRIPEQLTGKAELQKTTENSHNEHCALARTHTHTHTHTSESTNVKKCTEGLQEATLKEPLFVTTEEMPLCFPQKYVVLCVCIFNHVLHAFSRRCAKSVPSV
jgi:hypothetical protein